MSFKDEANVQTLVIMLLEDMKEATTKELVEEATTLGIAECPDRLPSALAELASQGKIKKYISKEKKAIVWSLK
ncbi:MAG: hypothetical protein ACTSW1_18820 [Candidatus Hodarchaeales archaeon]